MEVLEAVQARQLYRIGAVLVLGIALAPTTVAAMDNVSITLRYEMGGDTYIDDMTGSEGTIYTASDLSFPYVVTEAVAPDRLVGLVSTGDFLQLSYDRSGDVVRATVTQTYSDGTGTARILLPFTQAGHDAVEDREDEIMGGLFAAGGLLTYTNPSFAFPLTKVKLIQVSLEYAERGIDLIGFNGSLSDGIHRIALQNRGTNANGTVQVRVTQQ